MGTALLLGLAVAAGAFVQGSIGFGMAVVAAPFVVVWGPDLLPVALLVTSIVLPAVQLVHGPRHIDWRMLGWALLGRGLLTAAGVWVVSTFPVSHIAILVGALILLTVVASLTKLRIETRPSNAFLAGALAGVSGTAASIGGPFLALVLQHETPTRLRATLSSFFLVGSSGSLAALALGGQVRASTLLVGTLWIPFALAGYAAAQAARAHLHGGRLRAAVLAFCAVAGTAVIVRALLT